MHEAALSRLAVEAKMWADGWVRGRNGWDDVKTRPEPFAFDNPKRLRVALYQVFRSISDGKKYELRSIKNIANRVVGCAIGDLA